MQSFPRTSRAVLAAGLVALMAQGRAACDDSYDRDPDTIQRVIAESRRKWSAEEERRQGQRVADEIDRAIGVVDWPEQLERVQRIVADLAAHSDRPDVVYSVAILDTNLPNAMAIPGGFIRVTRGLLDMVQSDHELAGVLGHEMAHNCLYHGLRQAERDSKWERAQLVLVAGAILGAMAGRGGLDMMDLPVVAMAARIGMLSSYSRRYEREADWNGLRYCHEAGYDASGFYTFMERLMAWEAQQGWRRLPEHFRGWDEHPPTQQRLAEVMSYYSEKGIVFNRARVCRGFRARVTSVEVAQGLTVWEVRFGELVIFQPAATPVGGQTPEQRARAIAERINTLVERYGITAQSVSYRESPPTVTLHRLSVIEIQKEDADLVGLQPAQYAEAVYRAFRNAIYHSEISSKLP